MTTKAKAQQVKIYQVKIQADFHPDRLAACVAYNKAIRDYKKIEAIASEQMGANGTLELLIEAEEVNNNARTHYVEMEILHPTRAERRKEEQIQYDNRRGMYHYGMR